MRGTWVAVASVAVFVACGSEPARSADVDRACELLRVEKELGVPPPAMGTVTRSIAHYFTDFFEVDGSNATVYVAVPHAGDVELIADEVGMLDGVEVAEVLDQDAVYEEFKSLFADSPQLLDTVDPSVLPASIRVVAETDADLDVLAAWAEGDDRIQEVLDVREVGAVTLTLMARQFADELAELEQITDGDLKKAVQFLRTIEDPTIADISLTVDAIGGFIAENCAEP